MVDRHPDDLYITPQDVATKGVSFALETCLLLGLDLPTTVLEPGSGPDAPFLQAVREQEIAASLLGNDIAFIKDHDFSVLLGDYLYLGFGDNKYDLVITNPPFRLAEEFIRKSLTIGTLVCFLLRLSYLASLKRIPLWQNDVKLLRLGILSARPKFISTEGTDAKTDYGFFMLTLAQSELSVCSPQITWL